MNHIIFVAYYTPEYEKIAKENLIPSLEKFNLKYDVKPVPNLGSWYKNTAYKAKFVIEYLQYPFGLDVVLLDVDARIVKEPTLLYNIPDEYDIALHYLDWNEHYGYKRNPPIKELLSGTMLLKNNNKVITLCREWYEKANKEGIWEQKVLESILEKRKDIKIYELPREYCYITTLPRGGKPPKPCNAVIEHYQASRKYKKIIR